MNDIRLRAAEGADAAALAQLGRASFCAAFAHLYDAGDLNEFLDTTYTQQIVAREIADPHFTHCLAHDGGQLLAFCKLRRPSTFARHSGAKNPLSLNQLYTSPEHTGRGLGGLLMDWIIQNAHQHGNDAIQLSVWSGNVRAQQFYTRYGFAKIADIEFWVGSHRDDEFLLELELDP